ncbi:hypothetical protein B0T17DRAFT_615878 [Bombardia bombarda]|uniref:Uncharacterized protein n=1 Tax=Bombardia bombarda TaxID=252184 RepID=A0AA39XA78_9PEZI|nr:hypothetical protein B0T17DRAFT_615878 [Bombardia bombarda]
MAPIRRYLRITKYSVLECRIYLDNPALAQSWLLNPRNPVLPRVIESVRPLVLPKLLEERERERSKKKSKKRSIKDVVTEDDFEVSIFLTETDTRHSLLHKQRHFRDKTQTKLTSNSSKLTGESREAPIDVDVALLVEGDDADVPILRQESEDGDTILDDIPAIDETIANFDPANRRSKRRRWGPTDTGTDGQGQEPEQNSGGDDGVDMEVIDSNSSADDELFRRKNKAAARNEGDGDDKKKLAVDISYEGFAIYGRVLCLVVKRRDGTTKTSTMSSSSKSQTGQPNGQAVMENWITSTQLPEAGAAEDDLFE